MEALSQSPFLQALGYAIANSLWQVGLLWLLVVIVTNVFKLSSNAKYKIGATAQFAGFLWFIITLQFFYTKCVEALASAQVFAEDTTSYVAPALQSDKGLDMLSVVVKVEQLLPYLSIAYLALLLFLTVKWFRNYRYTQIIKSAGIQKIDVEWRLFVRRMTAALSLKNEVKIYLSEIIKSPLTIGFLKPIILIPVASMNYLTTEQLEAVILHELAHIKRFDYLINLVQSVIEIALFFNPFTQLLSNLIKKERENCCDDWVLQFQYNPSMYAEALLQIAYLQTQPALALNATGNKGGELLLRVKRLLNCNEKSFNYRNHVIALLLMTGIVSSIAWLQPTKTFTAAAKPNEIKQQPIVVEPMAAQVDNPLFNPVFFLSKPLKEEVSKAVDAAKKSVKEAEPVIASTVQKQLSTIAPVAIDKLNDVFDNKFQMQIAKATTDAEAEIAKIDWKGVNDAANQIFIDTLQIKKAIEQAFAQKKNLNFRFENMKKGLAQAKLAMKQFANVDVKRVTDQAIEGAFSAAFDELQKLNDNKEECNTEELNNVVNEAFRKQKDAKEERLRVNEQRRTIKLRATKDSLRVINFNRNGQVPSPVLANDAPLPADASSPNTYVDFAPPPASSFSNNTTFFRSGPAVNEDLMNNNDEDDKDVLIILDGKLVHVSKDEDKQSRDSSGGGGRGSIKITIEIE